MTVTIYHNPGCSKSRDVLQVILAAGYRPTIVEYVEEGWQRDALASLLRAAGMTPREALRKGNGPAEKLGLLDASVSDEAILDAMVKCPVLVKRPIVSTPKGTRLCRPVGTVLDLLDTWPDAPFAKSNGEILIDAQGIPVPGA